MNLVANYVLDRDAEMHDFRRDVYNTLEWGIESERQDMLQKMVAEIAQKNSQITSAEQLK